MFSKRPWRSHDNTLRSTLRLFASLAIALVLAVARQSASSVTSNLEAIKQELETQATHHGLYEQWRLAKNTIALNNRLDPLDRLADVLYLDDQVSDDQVLEKRSVADIRRLMLEAIDRVQHLLPHLEEDAYADEADLQGPSSREWGGWYEPYSQTSSARLTTQGIRDIACHSPENLTTGEALLRAGEALLFDDQFDCPYLQQANGFELLLRAEQSGEGEAAIKASILLDAFELVNMTVLNPAERYIDHLDVRTGQGIAYPSSIERTLRSLHDTAFETNHPLAHLALARFYLSKPLGGISSTDMRDCDRAAAHLLKALPNIEVLVGNRFSNDHNGASFDLSQDRLSALFDSGDLFELVPLTVPFANREDFEEQELHLHELSRAMEAEGELGNDGYLELQLADMYFVGAPHAGVEPQYGMAERMYRRAMRFGNGQAATSLATMTLSDQTNLDRTNKLLDSIRRASIHDVGEDEPSEIEDEYVEDEDAEGRSMRRTDKEEQELRNRTAYELYQQAADWGDPLGFVGLGLFYETGEAPQVTIKDKQKALEFYNKAAAQGSSEGDYRAARVFLSDTLLFNVTLGLERMKKAAETGHVAASYELGYSTLFWNYSLKGCEESVGWLMKAVRSDWTKDLPFGSTKGMQVYSRGLDDEKALWSFILGDFLLLQKHALMNAAFVLERGHLPHLERDWLLSASSFVAFSSTRRTLIGKRRVVTSGNQHLHHDDVAASPDSCSSSPSDPSASCPSSETTGASNALDEPQSPLSSSRIYPFQLSLPSFMSTSSLLFALAKLFKWPIHWRKSDVKARIRSRILSNVLAYEATQTNDAEARRKLAECLKHEWEGACDLSSFSSSGNSALVIPVEISASINAHEQSDAGDVHVAPQKNILKMRREQEARSDWFIKLAAEQEDDGESLFRFVWMSRRNETQIFRLLEKLENVDPNSWFLVESSRLFYSLKTWFKDLLG